MSCLDGVQTVFLDRIILWTGLIVRQLHFEFVMDEWIIPGVVSCIAWMQRIPHQGTSTFLPELDLDRGTSNNSAADR